MAQGVVHTVCISRTVLICLLNNVIIDMLIYRSLLNWHITVRVQETVCLKEMWFPSPCSIKSGRFGQPTSAKVLGAPLRSPPHLPSKQKMTKTYNSGYSLVVTHLTTNPPVRCLNRAERTGSLVVSCSLSTKCRKITVFGNSPTLTVPKSSI
jgi:hypothetical protein